MAKKEATGLARCAHRIGDTLAFIPVIFVHALLFWSYYVFTFVLLAQVIDSLYLAVVYGIIYHLFFILFVWSYWKTIFTKPMGPPDEFALTDEEMEQMMADGESPTVADKDLPVHTHDGERKLRFCRTCNYIKPDRCHHCSICRQCVLKMDHHCPWVCNCVGWHNYKYFCLFLCYGLTYLLVILLCTFRYFLMYWDDKLDGPNFIQVPFVFFVAFMFIASLFGLFAYHIFLVLSNTTTLETFKKPSFWNENISPKKKWSLSTHRANFEEVFGPFSWAWFVPIPTSIGDGVRFPLIVPLEGVVVGDGSPAPHESEEGLDLNDLASADPTNPSDRQSLLPQSDV